MCLRSTLYHECPFEKEEIHVTYCFIYIYGLMLKFRHLISPTLKGRIHLQYYGLCSTYKHKAPPIHKG